MSDEKVEKVVEKRVDLEKQVASLAFTVRKIKNKLEEQLGMDIDGDGRVGGGPFKKAIAFLLIAGMASVCIAGNTNIAVWAGTESSPTAGVHDDGTVFSPYFIGDGSRLENTVGVGSTLTPAYIWVGNRLTNAAAVAMSGDITIITNGTTTIGARKVLNTMLPAATDGQIYVGMTELGSGGSNVVARTITGAITISSNGTSALAGNISIDRLTNAATGNGLVVFTNVFNATTNIITVIGSSVAAP